MRKRWLKIDFLLKKGYIPKNHKNKKRKVDVKNNKRKNSSNHNHKNSVK